MSGVFFHTPTKPRVPQSRLVCLLWLLAWMATGCVTSNPRTDQPFHFGQDTFAYPNELVWEYKFDAETGIKSHQRRDPPARYSHRCFVMTRLAVQFHQHALFDEQSPAVSDAEYRRRIGQVISSNPRRSRPLDNRIRFPAYPNLHQFSQDYGTLLKAEAGGPLKSYFQRGHWRMLTPLTRKHQARIAQQLKEHQGPAVLHLVRFPSLTINHAVIVFGCREEPDQLLFDVYDPNAPAAPVTLTYNKKTQRFNLPQNAYFSGGRVDVYQVYHEWNY